jgi:hypothetical protein
MRRRSSILVSPKLCVRDSRYLQGSKSFDLRVCAPLDAPPLNISPETGRASRMLAADAFASILRALYIR